ncbi:MULTISPECIES: hypothetical protein [Photorhabdus]|nr:MULTISPECIES: hypothetical protein [Photorhabdus]MDB6367458.1 hypothetical protein [Photorhabdus bodei]
MSGCSQQGGNLKDDGYIWTLIATTGIRSASGGRVGDDEAWRCLL